MAKSKSIKSKKVKAAFNLLLPEDIAFKVDALLKTLPADLRKLHTHNYIAKSIEKEDRIDISTITCENPDKDCEIVIAKGVNKEWYDRTKDVFFNHNWDSELPIGQNIWIKCYGGNALRAKTRYFARPENHVGQWLPDTIWALINENALKGKSISFIITSPDDIRSPTTTEIEQRPEWKSANAIISKCMLLEYSVVSMPSQSDSLIESFSKPKPKKIFTANKMLAELLTMKINPKDIAKKAMR